MIEIPNLKIKTISRNRDGKTLLKAVDAGRRDYARGVRSLVYALWRGEMETYDFIDTMTFAVERGMTRAWNDGAKECGITPDELTIEEITARRALISRQYAYIVDFATAVEAGSKANKGKLTPLYRRAVLWINRYNEAYSHAQQMACGDRKLKWVMNPLKEHCGDCLMLDGRVYRASVWKKYNIHPQMLTLECRGYQCGCSFLPTDEPALRGHPPMIG